MQQKVPIIFRGLYLDCDLRFDLLVENCIIVEIKAVDGLLPIHEAQLLTTWNFFQGLKAFLLTLIALIFLKKDKKQW